MYANSPSGIVIPYGSNPTSGALNLGFSAVSKHGVPQTVGLYLRCYFTLFNDGWTHLHWI